MNQEDIVLVIYLNVGSKNESEVEAYMQRVKKQIEEKTNKFTVFFVPVRKDDTRIECINPLLLDKKEYAANVSKILVNTEIKLAEFLATPEPKKKVKKEVEPVKKVEVEKPKTKITPPPVVENQTPLKKPTVLEMLAAKAKKK